MDNISAFMSINRLNWICGLVEPIATTLQDHLRSSLSKQVQITLVVYYHWHPLSRWTERVFNLHLPLTPLLAIVHSHLLKKFKESYLGRWALWRIQLGRTINQGSYLEQIKILHVFKIGLAGIIAVDVDLCSWCVPKLCHHHLVHRQSASLVRTDIISSTHRLARFHSSN